MSKMKKNTRPYHSKRMKSDEEMAVILEHFEHNTYSYQWYHANFGVEKRAIGRALQKKYGQEKALEILEAHKSKIMRDLHERQQDVGFTGRGNDDPNRFHELCGECKRWIPEGGERKKQIVDGVTRYRRYGLCSIDHKLHERCEWCSHEKERRLLGG